MDPETEKKINKRRKLLGIDGRVSAYPKKKKPGPRAAIRKLHAAERKDMLRSNDIIIRCPRSFVRHIRKLAYQEYLKSSYWSIVRAVIMWRDNHRCRHCRDRLTLQVHHLNYDRLGQERYQDLITMCRRCHEAEHGIATIYDDIISVASQKESRLVRGEAIPAKH